MFDLPRDVRRLSGLIAAGLLVILLTLSGCGQPQSDGSPSGTQQGGAGTEPPPTKKALILTTLPEGQGYYSVGVAQAQVISKYTNFDVRLVPAPNAGPIPSRLGRKEADIALITGQTFDDALRGVGDYAKDGPLPGIRLLQTGHASTFGFFTHNRTGIKQISDLKGRKVSTPAVGSNYWLARYILEAYGLNIETDTVWIKAASGAEGFQHLMEGRVDAAFAGLEGAKLEDLATKYKPVLLPFDPAKIDIVRKYKPAVVIDHSTAIAGLPAGVPVVGTVSVLGVHADMDEETAYTLVKTLLEHYDELKGIYWSLQYWNKQNAVRNDVTIPYHPGAIRYYKEIGLWTPAMDRLQEKLLNKAKALEQQTKVR